MTQVDAVRRRLVESLHKEWIDRLVVRTSWPRDHVVDTLLAADCDQLRLISAYTRFSEQDNLNPFIQPPVHVRFLQFLQSENR